MGAGRRDPLVPGLVLCGKLGRLADAGQLYVERSQNGPQRLTVKLDLLDLPVGQSLPHWRQLVLGVISVANPGHVGARQRFCPKQPGHRLGETAITACGRQALKGVGFDGQGSQAFRIEAESLT